MRYLILSVFILFVSGCLDSSEEQLKISLEDIQGQLISSAYEVDYSLPEKETEPLNLLKDINKLFKSSNCRDISWGSDYPTSDMIGIVKVHLKVDGFEFEKYTQLDFYKNGQLVGRTCVQAPISGYIIEDDLELVLVWVTKSGEEFVKHKVTKPSSRKLVIENRSIDE